MPLLELLKSFVEAPSKILLNFYLLNGLFPQWVLYSHHTKTHFHLRILKVTTPYTMLVLISFDNSQQEKTYEQETLSLQKLSRLEKDPTLTEAAREKRSRTFMSSVIWCSRWCSSVVHTTTSASSLWTCSQSYSHQVAQSLLNIISFHFSIPDRMNVIA